MNVRACLLPILVVFFCSCDQKKEVVITETRAVTTKDIAPRLNATSDQRFRDAKPSPIEGIAPEGWLVQPSTQFRILNYRFGESGEGEVSVSLSTGGVEENTNRWLGQFSIEPLSDEAFQKLERVTVVGYEGVWVEAEGTYIGMGAEPKPDYGLAGVVAGINGRILTVKMTGPKAEVRDAHAGLRKFIESLTLQGEL